jgi:hypothetical protein
MSRESTLKRRIARLSVVEGKREIRGTAFAIGRRHLLTAFHVIGDRLTGTRFQADPTVTFEVPERCPTTARLTEHRDPKGDWALLELAEDLIDCEPFLLRTPSRAKDPWQSFGFAGRGPGQTYSGTITSHDPEIQLFCDQAHQGARVPGLSGAPCIVDGHAIGIIVWVSDPEGKDGAMFIRSIADIAARCPIVRALMPPPQPPFVLQVQADLEQPGVLALLPAAGALAKLPAVDQIAPARLAPLVAEKILLRQPRAAVELLEPLAPQLDQRRAEGILDFTASVWIHDDAAQVLAGAILASAPATIIGINAATVELGKRFVHRAGYPTASHPGWQGRMRSFAEAAGERRGTDFLRQARELLAQLLYCTDAELDEEYGEHVAEDGRPLILVVPPPVPPAEAVTRLHAQFAMARLVLLCGPDGIDDLITRFPTAHIVRPPLAPGEEIRANVQYLKALKMMAGCYEHVRPRGVIP